MTPTDIEKLKEIHASERRKAHRYAQDRISALKLQLLDAQAALEAKDAEIDELQIKFAACLDRNVTEVARAEAAEAALKEARDRNTALEAELAVYRFSEAKP